jgi:hypothetical protein
MKQFALSELRSISAPAKVLDAVERSEMSDVLVAPLRYRPPGCRSCRRASAKAKGSVCVAGDALHPTTPDLAQGACMALEDAVVLARCLGDAMVGDEETIEEALRRYAGNRRWRSAQVIAASYVVGLVQQSDHSAVSFVRDRSLRWQGRWRGWRRTLGFSLNKGLPLLLRSLLVLALCCGARRSPATSSPKPPRGWFGEGFKAVEDFFNKQLNLRCCGCVRCRFPPLTGHGGSGRDGNLSVLDGK